MQDQRFLFADPALRTVESGHPKKIKGSRKGCLFTKMVDSVPRFARLKIKFHRSALAQSAVRIFRSIPNQKSSPMGCSFGLVGDGGFGPPKSVTTDLQSAPFGRSGNPPNMSP